MPSAPDELRAKFPGSDDEALAVIKDNFVEVGGMIRPRVKGYVPTPRENEAIDYLWLEWDYAYNGEPKET